MATSVLAADALPTTLPPDFGEWDEHNTPAPPEESVSAQPASECAFDLASDFTPQFTFDLSAHRASQPVLEYTPEYTFDRTPNAKPAAEYIPQHTPQYTPEYSPDQTLEPALQSAADSCVAVMPPPAAAEPVERVALTQLAELAESDAPRIRPAAPAQKIYTCQKTFLDQLLAMPFDPAASRRDAALDSVSPLAIYEVQPADRAPIDIGTRKAADPASAPASSAPDSSAPDSSALNSSVPAQSTPELFTMVQPRKSRAAKSESLEAGNDNGSRTRKWIFTLGAIFAVTCALSFFGVLLFFGNGRSRQGAPIQSAQPQPAPSTTPVSTAPVSTAPVSTAPAISTASKPSTAQRSNHR